MKAPSILSRARRGQAWFCWVIVALLISAIGATDYLTGTELRVFALYYVPVAIAAWRFGRPGGLAAAAACSLAWLAFNLLGGLTYSHQGTWVANTLVQAVSFAFVGMLVAALTEAMRRERAIGRTDSLTGLLNVRAFYEEASDILSLCRSTGRPIVLAYIDLDNFKTVNDRMGHQAGDELLRDFAGLLQASIRRTDIVARLGGDEFALIMYDVNRDEAVGMLERLRTSMLSSFSAAPCPVTCTIGAAMFVSPPEDVEVMVHHADSRMYAAKAAGRNCVNFEIVDDAGAARRPQPQDTVPREAPRN